MAKAHILIIEGERAEAEAIREFLERNGYEVVCAGDGKSGIMAVQATRFDVIILDLVLPDMSGNDICRWLKLSSLTKGIPTIILTRRNTIADKVSALEAGADKYLHKPYDEIELGAMIFAALRTKSVQDELKQRGDRMEELLSKVEFLAVTDPLTGLYNRRYFESVLKKELTEQRRYGQPVSCFMVDVDHFKDINDTFGHEAGDAVLKGLSVILTSSLREVDTVARWGGEEFCVMMPHTHKSGALVPAQRLLAAVGTSRFEKAPDRQITVSIGLACTGKATDSVDKLVGAADFALYEAKRRGRNRIAVAPDEGDEAAEQPQRAAGTPDPDGPA